MGFWDGLERGMRAADAKDQREAAADERREAVEYRRGRDAIGDDRYAESLELAAQARAQANARYETGVATDNARYGAQQDRISRQDAIAFAERNAGIALAIQQAGGSAPSTESSTEAPVTTRKAMTPGGPPSNSLGRAPAPDGPGPDVPSEGSAIYSDDMTADAATLAGLVGSMDDMDEAGQSYWSTITSSGAASSEALNWFEKQVAAGNTVDIKDLPMYLRVVGATAEVGREELEDVRRRLALVGEGDIKYPELLQESLVAIGKFRAGEVLLAGIGIPNTRLTTSEVDRGFGDVLMAEADALMQSFPKGSPEQLAIQNAIGLMNGGEPGAVAKGRGELVRLGVASDYITEHRGVSRLMESYFKQISQGTTPRVQNPGTTSGVSPVLTNEPALGSTNYDPVPSLNKALEQGATPMEINQLKAELIDIIASSDSLTGEQKAEQATLVRGYQSVNQAPPGTGTERPISREEEVANMRQESNNLLSGVREGLRKADRWADKALGSGAGYILSGTNALLQAGAAASDAMGLPESVSDMLYREVIANRGQAEVLKNEGVFANLSDRVERGLLGEGDFILEAYRMVYNTLDKKPVEFPTDEEVMSGEGKGSLMYQALSSVYKSLGPNDSMDNPVSRGSLAPSSGSTASINTGRTGLGGTPSENNLSPRGITPRENPVGRGPFAPSSGSPATPNTGRTGPSGSPPEIDPQSEARVTEALTSILQSPETSEADKDQAMEEFMDLFGFSKTRQVVQGALGIDRVPTNR